MVDVAPTKKDSPSSRDVDKNSPPRSGTTRRLALRSHTTRFPSQGLMFHQIRHPQCDSLPIKQTIETSSRLPMRKPPNLSLHPHDQHHYNNHRTPLIRPITSPPCTTTATILSNRIFSNSPLVIRQPRLPVNPSCHPWHRSPLLRL